MARYGIDFYGSSVYGSPSFVDFDATPFEVLPYAAGQLQLHWSIPSGNWTVLRLVRNAYGWPVHEDDGRILLNLNMGPSATAPLDSPISDFIDTDLQKGRLYYYSVFVLGYDSTNLTTEWRRAADSTALSVGDWDYTERMLNLLPEVYWSDPTDDSGRNDQFVRFLSVFGFQLDYIRSQYETLRELYNPDKIAAGLLPVLGDQFGVTFEPEIGVRQQRTMVRNTVRIAKRRGTLIGTNTLISSFTGWDASIRVGVNLMLDYNDSSFEEIIGRWEPVGATAALAWHASDGTVAAFQASDFTNKQVGLMQVTGKGGDALFGCGIRHPIAAGVPVTAGAVYTLSGYVRSAVTPRSFGLAFRWYNGNGVAISDSSWGSSVTSTTTGWTRATATGTAPAGAVYAAPLGRVLSTVFGGVHYVDAVQFELGSSASAFQEARDVRVTLYADRVNELPNPSAEVNTTGWSATGAALARDTTVAYSGSTSSTTPTSTTGAPNLASFKLTATGAAAGILSTLTGTSGIPVQPGEDYTLSGYFFGSVNATAALSWYDASGHLLSTDTGQSVNWVPSAWIRPYATGTAPDNAVTVTATLTASFTAAGQVGRFDQVLLERTDEVRDYFDASQYITRAADYIWEGTAHQSRSHYYFNRTAKQYRLDALLTDYLLLGQTHTLIVAQPFRLDPIPVTENVIPGDALLLADASLNPSASGSAYGTGTFGTGTFG